MIANLRLLFLTDRGERHQRTALKSAPAGLEIVMKRRPSTSELLALLPTVDFLISERNQPVTADMIVVASRLKLIVRLGSLSYDIDVDTARAQGIHVSVQPVLGTIYCAEHALMMILAVLKRLGRSLAGANTAPRGMAVQRTDENTFAYNWLGYTDLDCLHGKTVSILGMGEIGVELARRLRPFRVKAIYYHKRRPYPQNVERELWVRHASLSDCLRLADIVVSLLPFSAETDRSIHAGMLALMKPSAALVHLGSGGVLDEQALVEALRAGKLAGAALDTFEYEPLQATHSLVTLARDPKSNLLLTPHTAAGLPEERSEDFAEIVRFISGEALRHEIA